MACQLNADGAGTAAANTVGDPVGSTSDGATSSATSMGMATSDTPGNDGSSTAPAGTGNDDDPPPATTDPDTGPGEDTTVGTGDDPGAAALEISDGSVFDFGNVPIQQQELHVFTVTNGGDGTATGMSGSTTGADFDFNGGSYPGNGGSCGETLDPGEECTLEVRFSPQDLGLYDGMVAVSYDAASDAERPLSGGGQGQSGNLLANPGGEDGGEPPLSWTAVVGGWTTGGWLTPQEGSNFIVAAGGPNNEAFRLRQDVAADAWAATIDAGAMRFAFSGFARSLEFNNDEIRFRIFYRDGGGANLETWTMDWTSTNAWTQFDESRIVPAGTRTIRVEANCRKAAGSFCDGYFDALDLRAQYP